MIGWIAFVALLLAAVACGGGPAGETVGQGPVSALDQEEATEMAENAMDGFHAGDYAKWSRDWSDAMKGAINEDAFLAFREQLITAKGEYQSIESVTIQSSPNEGYVRWSVVAQFENGQMRFNFTFPQDGRLIEGVFPEEL
jgi:hypothetical protein